MRPTTAADGLLRRLARELGDAAISTEPSDLRDFAEDALGGRGAGPEPGPALAVVRPADAAGIARVLALASEAGVAVVACGAGTGLMGGARLVEPAIVLDTSALREVIVSPGDRFVWAGAGAALEDVDRALKPHGLCIGHDPWTYPVATVGGATSTNGLGYRAGRYGGMGDQVLALEVALTDGTVVRTRPVLRRSTGPDLARLFVAAEGTLGVITAVALKAFGIPERQELAAFRFETFEAGFAAVDEMARLGLRPSLLDFGEEHASPWPALSQRTEEPPALYLGFEGFREEVDASIGRAKAVVHGYGGRDLPTSEAESLWATRHVVAERFSRERRRGGGGRWGGELALDYLHVALPPSRVLEYRDRCHEQTTAAGVGLFECGLWTAPEMFSCVLAYPRGNGGQDHLREAVDGLLRTAQDLGGSMEYCHGVGVRLAHLMAREHGAGLDLLRRLKRALDPVGILNPGKLGL